MRNAYKREDVFICRHDSHRRFDHRVSAHHVLREKRCYPEGCISFRWRCKLLDKRGACPKGYRHVGNNCTQCRYYDEEKIHRRPERLLDDQAFAAFREDCRQFDEWLEDRVGRFWEIGGAVTDVRPYLIRRVDGRRSSLRLEGFLVRLLPGYIGLEGFDDALYLRIGRGQQQCHRIAPGDRLEAGARLRTDRGRLVGERPRWLRIEQRGGRAAATWDQALLDRAGATTLKEQPERCLRCERGVLVDVEDVAARRPGARRRELICLEGIARPGECPYEALRAIREGGTLDPNRGAGGQPPPAGRVYGS